jgi:hypothetical protein
LNAIPASRLFALVFIIFANKHSFAATAQRSYSHLLIDNIICLLKFFTLIPAQSHHSTYIGYLLAHQRAHATFVISSQFLCRRHKARIFVMRTAAFLSDESMQIGKWRIAS